jgi:hypothetical protein
MCLATFRPDSFTGYASISNTSTKRITKTIPYNGEDLIQ